MSANSSKPRDAVPVIVLREDSSRLGRYLKRLLPALFGSLFFHVAMVIFFVLFLWIQAAPGAPEVIESPVMPIFADQVEVRKESFEVVEVGPNLTEPGSEINNPSELIDLITVPGLSNPNEKPGLPGGDPIQQPHNIPALRGFGNGPGGAMDNLMGPGGNPIDLPGGGILGPAGLPMDKSFRGRTSATREFSPLEGRGTTASEAAVTKGLRWLVRQQLTDGRWTLGNAADANPVAATALGLLPFLAAGKTHKADSKNPYDKNILKGIQFLKRSQDPKTGFFGGSMYSHGLATIAMCEAYGLSQDPALRRSAQAGINAIVNSQHDGNGGWSYGNNKTDPHRDLSISGWQIMALKSGQMAGLVVPVVSIERAKTFLKITCNADDGHGYTPGAGSTPRMTAVGLLCRQYIENWGPSNPQLIRAIKGYLRTNPPDRQDVYYYYYATQVMHHFGGDEWRDWNEKMREYLIKKQDTKGANEGSWSPEGDPWGGSGGRMMVTCLNILTLEVYYRYLPLYSREAGYSMDKAVQKAL
jgi:hypothetical protein